MSAHWVIWGGVTVLLCVVSWAAGRWLGTDPADDEAALDEEFNAGFRAAEKMWADRNAGRFDSAPGGPALGQALSGAAGLPALALDWREQTAHDLAPAVLAAVNVPEPGHGAQRDAATGMVTPDETAGLGHPPSPYGGPNLTAAQRRRDKHKQRGQYAPGELPDPPADVGAWWAGELAVLLEEGQSDWLTRNLAAA